MSDRANKHEYDRPLAILMWIGLAGFGLFTGAGKFASALVAAISTAAWVSWRLYTWGGSA